MEIYYINNLRVRSEQAITLFRASEVLSYYIFTYSKFKDRDILHK